MSAALEGLRRALAALAAVERALVTALVLFIVVNIGAQVFSRYALGRPLIWVEEAATYAFIWGTFLGAGLAMKNGRHVRIAALSGRLNPAAALALRTLSNLCVLILAATLARQAWTVIGVESMRSTVTLPVRLPASLFFSLPLLTGMASAGLTAFYLTAEDLAAAASGRPRRPILPPDFD